MLLIRFIDLLFTFSRGGNQNQQGGGSLWCGLWFFQVAWWHLDVAAQYFEEIL